MGYPHLGAANLCRVLLLLCAPRSGCRADGDMCRIVIMGSVIAIESPRWYCKVGRPDTAADALSKIRNLPADHEYITWELNEIQGAPSATIPSPQITDTSMR